MMASTATAFFLFLLLSFLPSVALLRNEGQNHIINVREGRGRGKEKKRSLRDDVGKDGRVSKKNTELRWKGKRTGSLWILLLQRIRRGRRKRPRERRKRSRENFFSIIMSIDAILVERTRKERQSRACASSLIEQYVTTLC